MREESELLLLCDLTREGSEAVGGLWLMNGRVADVAAAAAEGDHSYGGSDTMMIN